MQKEDGTALKCAERDKKRNKKKQEMIKMEKEPVKHNRLRRMEKHDYTSACIYLITVTTTDRKRVLGSLVGDTPNTAAIEPTALGEYVVEAFRRIASETSKRLFEE